jgi:hypothetical protein
MLRPGKTRATVKLISAPASTAGNMDATMANFTAAAIKVQPSRTLGERL